MKQVLPVAAFLIGLLFLVSPASADSRKMDSPADSVHADYSGYADRGDALREGLLLPVDVNVSYRLPMATIFASLVASRDPVALSRLLQALEALLAFSAAALLCDSFYPALAAALLDIVCFGQAYYQIDSEACYALLLLLVAGLLAWRSRRPSLPKTWLLSAAIGLSLLYRSPLAFFPPLLAFFEWAFLHRFSRSYWKQAAVLCLVPYGLLVPWIRMNWIVYHAFVLFEKGASHNNIISGALGFVMDVPKLNWVVLASGRDFDSTSSVMSWALGEIASHPARYLSSVVRRWEFVFFLHPALTTAATAAAWVRRKRPETLSLALLALYFIFINCLMAVEERYFFPLWPLEVVLIAPLAYYPWRERAQAAPPRAARAILGFFFATVASMGVYTLWVVHRYGEIAAHRAATSTLNSTAGASSDGYALAQEAEANWHAGRIAPAAEDLTQALRLYPHDREMSLRLAWLQMLEGRSQPLLKWKLFPEDDPNAWINFEAYALKAHEYLRLGQAHRAYDELSSSLRLFDYFDAMNWGPRNARETQIIRELPSHQEDFALACFEAIYGRPASEMMAMGRLLERVIPNCATVRLKQAEISIDEDDLEAAWRSLLAAGRLRKSRREELWLESLSRRIGPLKFLAKNSYRREPAFRSY